MGRENGARRPEKPQRRVVLLPETPPVTGCGWNTPASGGGPRRPSRGSTCLLLRGLCAPVLRIARVFPMPTVRAKGPGALATQQATSICPTLGAGGWAAVIDRLSTPKSPKKQPNQREHSPPSLRSLRQNGHLLSGSHHSNLGPSHPRRPAHQKSSVAWGIGKAGEHPRERKHLQRACLPTPFAA